MRLEKLPKDSWVIFTDERALVFRQVNDAYLGHLDVPLNLRMSDPTVEKTFVVKKAGKLPVSASPGRQHVYDIG